MTWESTLHCRVPGTRLGPLIVPTVVSPRPRVSGIGSPAGVCTAELDGLFSAFLGLKLVVGPEGQVGALGTGLRLLGRLHGHVTAADLPQRRHTACRENTGQ